jgi:hypothetical protein
MADEGKEVQSVDWRRCFASLEILRSFRMAIHPGSLLLCFLGLAATFWIAVALDEFVFQTSVYGASFYTHVHRIMTTTLWGNWALPYVGGSTGADFLTFLLAPVSAAREVLNLAFEYWWREPWFAVVGTVIALALWAIIGGAVTRMAAVRVAREESVPLGRAVRFSLRKWPSTVTSPLIPFGVLVLLAALVGSVTGVGLMIPYLGEFGVGVIFFLTLLMGLVLALIFLGGTFSLGLQWPTIAAEGSDSFDAISRSISYVSARPWKYLFYTIFATVYGCAAFILVKFTAYLTLRITHEAVSTFSWGGGDAADKLMRLWEAPTLTTPWPTSGGLEQFGGEATATYLFLFWGWVVLGVAAAFLVNFAFASQTVIYFLLRKSVDATDIEEVYLEESEEEELPLEHKAEAAPEAAPAEAAPEAEKKDEPPAS